MLTSSRGRCPIYIKRLSREDLKKTSDILILAYYERNEATSIHDAHVNDLGDSDSSTDEADSTITHGPRPLRVSNAHIYRHLDFDRTMLLLASCSTWRRAASTRSSEPSPVEVFFKHSAAMSTTAMNKTQDISYPTGLCNVAQSY